MDLRLLSDEEKSYILRVFERIKRKKSGFENQLRLLDEFFIAKYTGKTINIGILVRELDEL